MMEVYFLIKLQDDSIDLENVFNKSAGRYLIGTQIRFIFIFSQTNINFLIKNWNFSYGKKPTIKSNPGVWLLNIVWFPKRFDWGYLPQIEYIKLLEAQRLERSLFWTTLLHRNIQLELTYSTFDISSCASR